MPFLRGLTLEKWRTEVHWEVDFRYFDEYPDIFPAKELGIDAEECSYNVIRDERYKYVHFAALPPVFFDLKQDPHELQNLADDPAYRGYMLEYAQKLLSWRMANDERTLTHLTVGPAGVAERTLEL